MTSTFIRRAVGPGVAALALAMTGCAAGNEATGNDGGGESELSGTLAGGGASTQQAAMEAWSIGFQEQHPDTTVEYDPVGSGGGRENFISGGFAFAGSDAYLTNDEGELDEATERCGGEAPIEVPSYVSPIALIYNLPGVDELQLSPEAIAGIFAGEIKKWNDEAIAATNEGVDLPDANINPVHRSDESGTTENFTTYLDQAAGQQWGNGVVETWPGKAGGEGAKGTAGVISAVEQGENSIGYADASQSGHLSVAKVQVGEEFVEPSAEAAAKILEVSPKAETAGETQLVYDLDHSTAEAGTYPIVLTSYLMACQSYDDAARGELVKEFLTYVIGDEGQTIAQEEAGSAPLSDSLQQEALGIIEQIG